MFGTWELSHDSGSCTIAIANLNEVLEGYLLERLQPPFPVSDAATRYDVRDALSTILGNCLYGRNPSVGLAVIGESSRLRIVSFETWYLTVIPYWLGEAKSIGVFIFGTWSGRSWDIPYGVRPMEVLNDTTGVEENLDIQI